MSLEKSVTPDNNLNVNVSEVFKEAREREIMLPAYEKATKLLARESIKPEMFDGTYQEELMARHARYVEEHEASFALSRQTNEGWARAEIFGKTLEGILHDQVNKGVYGEDVRGISTAPYDDIHAGVDEVLERYGEDGSTYIGCALDMTFGNPQKKIDGICEDIKKNKLKDVFYYESPFGDPPLIHGKLQGIPKVVIGMDAPHLVNLAQQWIDGDQEIIQNNQLFLNFLRQIQVQAEVYQDLAKKFHQPEIAARYQKVHSAITKLYREQKTQRGVDWIEPDITNDLVNQSIQQQVSQLLK
jgi:pterin-4a-carbinolamine dehydratase